MPARAELEFAALVAAGAGYAATVSTPTLTMAASDLAALRTLVPALHSLAGGVVDRAGAAATGAGPFWPLSDWIDGTHPGRKRASQILDALAVDPLTAASTAAAANTVAHFLRG